VKSADDDEVSRSNLLEDPLKALMEAMEDA
jgi:hypothetical protein